MNESDAIKGNDDELTDDDDQPPDSLIEDSLSSNVYMLAPASRPDAICGNEFLRDTFIVKEVWAA